MTRTILLVLMIFITSWSWGQRYSFLQYSTSNGLPQSQVTSITQDDIGYLWIGTYGGLAKFNGSTFVKLGRNNGLLNNSVSHLTFLNGKLYVGHHIGISIRNKDNDFQTISFPEPSNYADVTGFEKLGKQIFVATNGNGLFLIDQNDELIAIEGSPERIRDILVYHDQLFLATRNGIVKHDGKQGETILNTEDISFSGIAMKDDKIIATSYSGDLYEVDSSKGITRTIFEDNKAVFRNLSLDGEQNIWVYSNNGIWVLKENDTLRITELEGLISGDIDAVFNDNENNIWIGTNGKGMLRFTNEVFIHYNEKNNFPSDLIIAVNSDKNKEKWISSIDQGVFKWNKNETLPIDYIPSTVWQIKSNEDAVLFASDYGLFVYDYEKFYAYYEEDGLPANRIIGAFPVSNHVYLISTQRAGVYFDTRTKTFLDKEDFLTKTPAIRDLKVENSTYYAATEEGLLIFKDNTLTSFPFEGSINGIEIDKYGKIWVGTENGLFFTDGGELKPVILGKEGELEYINFLQKYNDFIFAGTNDGVYEIDKELKARFHYGIHSGLIDLETNLNSNFLEENRYLWFGTASGIMRMDLSERNELFSKIQPELQLRSISINNQNLPLNEVAKYNLTKEAIPLKLKFSEKHLSFTFDGVYLTNPNDLLYSYYLEGFSEEWSTPISNPNVNFTNLSPGKYIFLFKAKTDFSESEIFSLNIRILPPFYRTWWFYSLVAITLLATGYLIERQRIRKQKQRNYQLHLEFQNKLRQLEQQSLNASMNRHFIFNSLNSIQYYINISDTKAANRYLSKFAKLIRKNLDSSHNEDGMVTLADEIERVELYLELESMRFIDKFTYTIELEDKVESEALKVPAMFLQPFVENSILHGILPLKDRIGNVTISVKDHFNHVYIEVRDNGVGIDKSLAKKKGLETDHHSQGMIITQKRIELLQKFSEESIKMIGPRQINEKDSSINGTLVVFKILKQYLVDY